MALQEYYRGHIGGLDSGRSRVTSMGQRAGQSVVQSRTVQGSKAERAPHADSF